jgi:hypothetical protein
MTGHVPKHYRIEVRSFAEAGLYLDSLYGTGWRVVQMAAHPDGARVIFLLEKMPTPK